MIYQDALRLNMTQSGYAWLVTEQAIKGEALMSAPEGLIGMHLQHGGDTKAHIEDSVKVVAKGIHSFVQNEGIVPPPSDCRQPDDSTWPSGSLYYKYEASPVANLGFHTYVDQIEANVQNRLIPFLTDLYIKFN